MLLILLQDVPPVPDLHTIKELGPWGALLIALFYFYRQDRKASEDKNKELVERMIASRKESDERFAAIAEDFKDIVKENTSALTRLMETVGRSKN